MNTASRAVARILIWRPVLLAVYLASMVILARLLDPAAFGAFAIAAAVFWFADTLIDFGISAHLFRDPDTALPPDRLGAALGLWWATTFGTAVLVAAMAWTTGYWGWITGVSEALWIILLALPFAPLIKLRETRALRALDTSVLAWLPVAGAVAGLAVSVTGALWGLGASALAAGLVAERATLFVVLAAVFRESAKVRPQASGWAPLIRFGSAFTATTLLPKITDVARLSIVGATLGAASLGVLNRALQVANLNDRVVLEAVLPVAMPVMADAMRGGATAQEVYATKIDYLAALCWPAALAIIVLAEPLVLVLLGPTWAEAIVPVQILAAGALTYPVNRMSAKFFALVGLERPMLRIQIIQQGVLLILMGIGAFHSLAAVCLAIVTAQAAKALQVTIVLKRHVPADRAALRAAVGRGMAIAAATAIGPGIAVHALPIDGAAGQLALGLVMGTAGWIGGVAVTRHRLGAQLWALRKGFAGAA